MAQEQAARQRLAEDNWLTRMFQPSAAPAVPAPSRGERANGAGNRAPRGHPLMTRGRHPRRRRRLRQLHRRLVAAGRAARHQPRDFRAVDRRADAGPEHHGPARCPAGIQQIAMGLSRHAGERRAHRARPRAVGAIRLGFRRGRARLRRRSLHRRGDLGRGIELRHQGRRPSGAALDRDARLRRPPPRLFPRGVSLGAGDRGARRRQARPPDRLVGRRVRPDPIHADDVQALRRRLRSTTAAATWSIRSPT